MQVNSHQLIKIIMAKKRYNRCKRRTVKRKRKQQSHSNKFNATLKRLKSLKAPQRRQAIEIANDKFIRHFVAHVKKLKRATGLRQSLKTKLKRHTKTLRKLTNKRGSLKSKRKMLAQRGGFLPLLLAALPAIGSIAGGLISRA